LAESHTGEPLINQGAEAAQVGEGVAEVLIQHVAERSDGAARRGHKSWKFVSMSESSLVRKMGDEALIEKIWSG
jgi:hypothetical protein